MSHRCGMGWGREAQEGGVKNLLPMQETQVPSLGWEDPLKKEMATHSYLGNPMDTGTWQATVYGFANSGT